MAQRFTTARAKVGATMLDVIQPGWHRRINLDTLNLSGCEVCVLGQLFNGFGLGAEQLFAMAADGTGAFERSFFAFGRQTKLPAAKVRAATDAGFLLATDEEGPATYRQLTDAWKREVRKRQKRDAA